MQDQKLQLQLQSEAQETVKCKEEEEEEEVIVTKEEYENDQEFYEKIEAPKFVDFTKPYTFRTDDRYWFCSRVGCDQKHEEEINPEEISKNFVLRVLAARSPNIKLRKALNREHVSMKCPLSAPAKPSKPRIPTFSTLSSFVSRKNGDTQSKSRPRSKNVPGSTPVAARSRQVAAKYMTTPRNKMCKPDPNSFRSVQNPKKTTVDETKNRPVAKALVFHSPKKVICLKKSAELQIPLTKICQGIKRLEIASQKKTLKISTKSKVKQPETEDLSKRKSNICKSDKTSKDSASSKSTKILRKTDPSKKSEYLNEKVVENESGDLKTSETSVSADLRDEKNELSNLEDKENVASVEDLTNYEHRSNNQQLGDKILSKETQKKNKVLQTVMKCKKQKPTNFKPFRLRTDERGILREAILEKKLNVTASEKEIAKDSSVIKRTFRVAKNDKFPTSNICKKESSTVESKPATNDARKRPESTHQRFTTSLTTRTQGTVSPKKVRMPGQQLCSIKEKSSKLASDFMMAENTSRAVSGSKSTARGKRPLTVAKEPKFHTSHLPSTCLKNTA